MTSLQANSAQAEVWNGESGVRWAENHRRYDTMASGFNAHLFHAAAFGDGDRVLDIGCGTGHTTRLVARRIPLAKVLGIDLSTPMLERARHLAVEEGIGNVSFIRGDAQVHPFAEGGFDVALSRHGVMFFADPVAAFTNVRHALKPGGRLVFTCHRGGDKRVNAIFEAMTQHVRPSSPDEHSSAVARFADPNHVRQLVTAAGFDRFTATPIETVAPLGTDATEAAYFLFEDHLRPYVRDADEPARRRACRAVAEVLKTFEQEGEVRLPAPGWLFTVIRRPTA
jgi:SAM-dependent methyltransferase